MVTTPRHPALILAALASGFVMASIDSTVVNVATVSIGQSFDASLEVLTWVVDGYVLTFASLLLMGGSLATALGSRRLYLTGMGVFLAASLGCAIAPDAVLLIVARAVQGAGAAMFMPSSLSLLVSQFTRPRQRARMLGLWSAMVAMSAAIGPTLGGILVSSFGWRSIFLINLPVVIVGTVLTRWVIPDDRGTRQRISVLGHLNLLVVVASAAFVLIQGHSSGFATPLILIVAGILILGTIFLILGQRGSRHPVMPWELFRNRGFATPNLVGFLYSAALYGGLYLMGLFFQNARHASPLEAGLQLLPMTVCFPLGNILYTRIHHRVSNAVIMAVCLLLAGAATLLLVGVEANTPYWYLAISLGIANSGAGLVTASMTAATVAAADDRHANYAGAILNTNRQVGVLIGVAVTGLVLQATSNWYAGLHLSVAIVAATYLIAGLAALTLVVPAWRTRAAV